MKLIMRELDIKLLMHISVVYAFTHMIFNSNRCHVLIEQGKKEVITAIQTLTPISIYIPDHSWITSISTIPNLIIPIEPPQYTYTLILNLLGNKVLGHCFRSPFSLSLSLSLSLSTVTRQGHSFLPSSALISICNLISFPINSQTLFHSS